MAEALSDGESPFSDYLRQTHSDSRSTTPSTSSLPSPPASTSSQAPSDAPSPPSIPPSTRPSSRLRPRTRAAEQASERVKYALATSALLSVKLSDAVQLYPPLDTLPKVDAKGGKGKQRDEDSVDTVEEGTMSWPEDWEQRGQGWLDRSVVGNAEVALSGLVSALKRFSRTSPVPLPRAVARRSTSTKAGPEEEVVEKVERFVSAAQELDLRVAAALSAIKELECIAHGLGLSDPLPPISRIEARSYASLLSPVSPLRSAPASQPFNRTPSRSPRLPPRVPSPLIPSPPRLSSSTPLRALALREALHEVLSAALTAFTTASAELNDLLPLSSPLLFAAQQPSPSRLRSSTSHSHVPQASLSELLRHTRLAAQDRAEVESFHEGSVVSSSHSRNTSLTGAQDPAFDPFHPTESTFGGFDRRRDRRTSFGPSSPAANSSFVDGLSSLPLKRQASLTLRGEPRHRVRPSLGAVGAFGLGTAAAASSPARAGTGGRAKRPVSMGGGGLGSGLSSAFRLRSENGSAPSSPALSAREVEELPEEESEAFPLAVGEREGAGMGGDLLPFLLVSLQESFEDAHDARKAVLWRVLAALEETSETMSEEEGWRKVGEAVAKLEERLRAASARVMEAVDTEFGSSGTAASRRPKGEERGDPAGAATAKDRDREREKRRRSGYYGRPELDLDDSPVPSPISPFANIIPPSSSPSPFATPAPTPFTNGDRDHLRAGVQSALARLTSGSPSQPATPSPARRFSRTPAAASPAAFATFAPPSSSSVAPSPSIDPSIAALQHNLASLSLPLRSLQAKLRLLSSDLPSLPSPDEAETGRLLATYDSLLPDIEALFSSFHTGRGALRVALGVDAPVPPAVEEEEEELPATHAPLNEATQDAFDAPPEPDLGAVYASLDTSASPSTNNIEDDFASRQALLDAALSLSLLPPSSDASSPLVEKVFEAVAGPERVTTPGGGKLSREERIRRMKEAREALAVGRTSLGGGEGVGGVVVGGGGGGVDGQKKMVGELREVLRELNREKGRV